MTGGDVADETLVVVGDAPPDRDVEFAAFVRATSAELGRVAWYLCGDPVRAEDLLQQSLLRTYLAWGRAREGDPVAYARRVLSNGRIDGWRRERREVLSAPQDLPDGATSDGAAARAERDRLGRALRALPARQRRVVVLRHLVGLSEKEVAAELAVSLGTVKSTASRGLARLRAELGEDPDDGAAGRAAERGARTPVTGRAAPTPGGGPHVR